MSRPFDPNREEYFNRVILADVYPRKEDPFRPGRGAIPGGAPAASMVSPEELAAIQSGQAPIQLLLTPPGQRPVVFQTAANISLSVGTTPTAFQNSQYQCDGFMVSVDNTLTTSVFIGYGSGVTVLSGIEVQPGIPQLFAPDNNREMWELQRGIEQIAAMMALFLGYSPLDTYRAPRVVFDASKFYAVATATVNASIMLFNVPEQQ